MALVMNASADTVEFRAYGSHFSMKSGQIKTFQDHIARFIVTNESTRSLGLVGLPEELEDIDFRQSAAGLAAVEEKKKEGVNNRIAHLRQVIYNNQVSLRQDLEKSNLKADPRAFASEGEVKAFEELVKYQAKKEDEDQKRIDKIKALESRLKD